MTSTWRDRIEVHPAADMFPMMSDGEIKELAADIAENGQRVGVILWTPERPEDVGPRKGPKKLFLLDGRNRLEAIERAYDDAEDRDSAVDTALSFDSRVGGTATLLYGDEDPYAAVVSANIRRRHLTAAQKREIIAELLRQKPERSDNATAKIAGVSDKTVTGVRAVLERGSEIPNLDNRVGADGVAQPAHKVASKGTTPRPAAPPKPISQASDKAAKALRMEIKAEVTKEVAAEYDIYLARLKPREAWAEGIIASHKGVMTREMFRKIKGCLHPDHNTFSHAAEALQAFSELEKVLVKPEEAAFSGPPLPETVGELLARRRTRR